MGGDPNKTAVPLWFLMFLPLLWVWSDSTEKGGKTSSLCSKEPGGDPFYQVFELWLLSEFQDRCLWFAPNWFGWLGRGVASELFLYMSRLPNCATCIPRGTVCGGDGPGGNQFIIEPCFSYRSTNVVFHFLQVGECSNCARLHGTALF